MALPVLLKVAAEIGGVELATRAAKTIWSKMPWAADANKRKAADAAADRFLLEAESLLQAIENDDEAARALSRLADSLEKNLQSNGLTAAEAAEVRQTLMQQIEVRALQPIRQYRSLRLQAEASAKELEALKASIKDMQAQFPKIARRAEAAFLGLGLALGLAIAALAVSLR